MNLDPLLDCVLQFWLSLHPGGPRGWVARLARHRGGRLERSGRIAGMLRAPRRTPRLLALAVVGVALAGCSATTSTTPTASKSPSPSGATPSGSGSSTVVKQSAGPPGGQASTSNPAASLQENYVSVYKKVRLQVVQIQTDQGLGSGIVFDNRGDIVTNAHVVEQATTFKVTFADGKTRPASLVGSFFAGDVAVVHIDGLTVPPATFADSTRLEVGDIVMAVGNPLGLSSSVTSGIVSAVGRTRPEGNGNTLPDLIQTSAPINPGNSGGALVDLNGNVVGIPTLAASDPQLGGAAGGIGFAIPSNTARDIAAQLISTGHVTQSHRAFLGIRGAGASDGSGVIIGQVESGGPAASAGLQAGDLLTGVNGQAIASTDKLNELLAGLKPGDHASLSVTRSDGSTTTLQVTLGQLPG
ncbi:MAG: trypsin-like peptidase domain-containing protein [Candidatus Dormibacteraeota bacterium]|nr:trypsin-like peptidase domain-containing protein [Candidatus Dormibacteraeota bacterium]